MTERRMRSVSQRNPADPEHAGAGVFDRMFRRGPDAAADGGEHGAAVEPDGGGEDADEEPEGQKMKDVDQSPPDEDASANRVWERGGEPAGDADEADDGEDDSGGTGADAESDDEDEEAV